MIMIHDACQGNLSYDYMGFSQKFDVKLKISMHMSVMKGKGFASSDLIVRLLWQLSIHWEIYQSKSNFYVLC